MARAIMSAVILIWLILSLPSLSYAEYSEYDEVQVGGFFGTLDVAPRDVTWDGLVVTFTGVDNVDQYVVKYRLEGIMDEYVTVCTFDGPYSAGVTAACVIGDGRAAGRRGWYVVEAIVDGEVHRSGGFQVVHAVHVELGKYSLGVLRDILDAVMGKWFGVDEQSLLNLEYELNRLRNYPPFSEASSAYNRWRNTVGQAQWDFEGSAAASLFEFNWCNQYSGQCYEFRIPIREIMSHPFWDKVWLVINATIWAAFFFWLVRRVSPQTGV